MKWTITKKTESPLWRATCIFIIDKTSAAIDKSCVMYFFPISKWDNVCSKIDSLLLNFELHVHRNPPAHKLPYLMSCLTRFESYSFIGLLRTTIPVWFIVLLPIKWLYLPHEVFTGRYVNSELMPRVFYQTPGYQGWSK